MVLTKNVRRFPPKRGSLEDRFWPKVDVRGPEECWPWMAGTDGHGYGVIWDLDLRRMEKAPRVAFRLAGGVLLDGQEACHTCDNPPCCNSRHLFAGTQQENIADMHRKGRGGHPNFVGETHPNAKLSNADVAEIRRRYVPRQNSAALAVEFGVTRTAISQIATGRWRRNG